MVFNSSDTRSHSSTSQQEQGPPKGGCVSKGGPAESRHARGGGHLSPCAPTAGVAGIQMAHIPLIPHRVTMATTHTLRGPPRPLLLCEQGPASLWGAHFQLLRRPCVLVCKLFAWTASGFSSSDWGPRWALDGCGTFV